MVDDDSIVVERRVMGFSKLFLRSDLLLSFVRFAQGLGQLICPRGALPNYGDDFGQVSITAYFMSILFYVLQFFSGKFSSYCGLWRIRVPGCFVFRQGVNCF
jgi:hypothetical protein